ncbi:hypothetical protein COL70_30715, partial [Bacillus pseudomycoides]
WWFWVIIFVFCGVIGSNMNSENNDSKPVVAENKSKEVKKTGLTVDEYQTRINKALKETGEKTKLKINSTNVTEDGKTAINLSQNIII